MIELKNAGLDANLSELTLRGANLRCVDMRATDPSGADLSSSDLELANLRGAIITCEQLAACESFEGATMPEGPKRHSPG